MGRPSFRDFWKNFDEYDAPVDRRVGKLVINNLRKLTTLSECCVHHGEPGC